MKRFWQNWLDESLPLLLETSINGFFQIPQGISIRLQSSVSWIISLNPQHPLTFIIFHSIEAELYPKFHDFLNGSRILNVSLLHDDQVLKIELQKRHPLGDQLRYEMFIELIPRFSNLIIIKNNIIHLAYKYYNHKDNPLRPILIRETYQLPPPPQIIRDFNYLPKNISDQGNYPFNQALETAWQSYTLIDPSQQIAVEYARALDKETRRMEKLLDHLLQELSDTVKLNWYYRCGAAIQNSIHLIPSDCLKIELPDYTVEPPVTISIPLQKDLKPADQCRHYFERYKRLKKTREGLSVRIDQIRQKIYHLKSEKERIHDSPLEALQRAYQKFIKENTPRGRPNSPERNPAIEFYLSTGRKVWVGRSAADNDFITFKVAKGYDFWFHARIYRGSHVIAFMRSPQESLTYQEIEETAQIAAFYSEARNSGLVPVDYTRRKYVRKPQKAVAGKVIFEREKTVMVPPKLPHIQSEEKTL